MGLTSISYKGPVKGITPTPISEGPVGIESGCRQQESVVVGMAAAWKNSASQADLLSYYKFGSASARPEFAGVVASAGNSPALTITVCTTDAEDTQLVYAGLTPVLLAPGESVRRGQFLEPIPSGANQAMFRVAPCGPVQAWQSDDNSDGETGKLITGFVNLDCGGSGVLDAIGPSNALTGTTAETVYQIGSPAANAEVDIPAYSLRVGDRLRICFGVTASGASSGAYAIKLYPDGTASTALVSLSATFGGAGEVAQGQVELYVKALTGANNVAVSGMAAIGVAGTATYRPVAGQASLDLTQINSVLLAATPSNNNDSTTLQYLSVEKL